MRKIHLTKLLISAWMLMVGFAVQAQVYTEFNMTGKKPAGVQYTQSGMDLNKMDKHQYGYMTVYTPKQELKAPKRAEPGEVTLTFNLVYDPAVFMPPFAGVTIINENYRNDAMWMGEDIVTATVPTGTYDFAVQFQSMEKSDQYWVIREQVEVTEDATFTLTPEEATNHISFVNYGPDANVLKHALWGGEFDEETGEQIILEEGDVEVTSIRNAVYLKGVGCLFSGSNMVTGAWPEELRTAPFNEYYVNDVSDRYLFTQSRTCSPGPEVWYVSYFSTNDVKAGVLENNPEDYVLCQENYQFSPHGQGEPGYGAGVTVYNLVDGKLSNWGTQSFGGIAPKQGDTYSIDVYNSISFENPNDEGLNLLVGNQFIDYFGIVVQPWGEEEYDIAGKTIAMPYAIENGQQVFHNIGHFDSYGAPSGKTGALTENGRFRHQLLPAPAAFTYPVEERLGTVGDNCPINAVNVLSFYNEYQGDVMSFGNNYVGRYGESRLCDDAEVTLTFKFNGEEIEDPANWSPNGKGTWEFTVTNTNIVVDGLQGENKTVVYFDQTNEESTCPGIEMLHFRSEAGITDRFATAADGTMEFMGGAFKFNYYPDFWDGAYDECQPMEVTVEYSPYGEENWRALAVEEVPELFQMPGWGYFYRASLAEVTGKATKGWFDVRFKLQDEAGNWQEQVVSPAFRIDNLVATAVEEVAATTAREVARYSVDGRQLTAPQPGLNIIKMSDGTSKKVWVK